MERDDWRYVKDEEEKRLETVMADAWCSRICAFVSSTVNSFDCERKAKRNWNEWKRREEIEIYGFLCSGWLVCRRAKCKLVVKWSLQFMVAGTGLCILWVSRPETELKNQSSLFVVICYNVEVGVPLWFHVGIFSHWWWFNRYNLRYLSEEAIKNRLAGHWRRLSINGQRTNVRKPINLLMTPSPAPPTLWPKKNK